MLEALTPRQRVRLNLLDNKQGAEILKQKGDCFQRFLFKSTYSLWRFVNRLTDLVCVFKPCGLDFPHYEFADEITPPYTHTCTLTYTHTRKHYLTHTHTCTHSGNRVLLTKEKNSVTPGRPSVSIRDKGSSSDDRLRASLGTPFYRH